MPTNVQSQRDPAKWQEELGMTLRIPRPGWEHVRNLLRKSWPPQISLREDGDATEIVLRFPSHVQQLPPTMREMYSRLQISFRDVFEEILWMKPSPNEQRTLWSRLANDGYKAYRQMWVHLLRLLYLHHFHPTANNLLCSWIESLKRSTERGTGGRRGESQAERDSLQKRFHELLPKCELIHQAVEAVVTRDNRLKPTEIRKQVWEAVWKSVHGMRGDDLIFGGKAFDKIAAGKRGRVPCLHDPQSWKPRELAVAVLVFERELKYSTLEKKLRGCNKNTKLH